MEGEVGIGDLRPILTWSACWESRPIPSTWKSVLATPTVGMSDRTPR